MLVKSNKLLIICIKHGTNEIWVLGTRNQSSIILISRHAELCHCVTKWWTDYRYVVNYRYVVSYLLTYWTKQLFTDDQVFWHCSSETAKIMTDNECETERWQGNLIFSTFAQFHLLRCTAIKTDLCCGCWFQCWIFFNRMMLMMTFIDR